MANSNILRGLSEAGTLHVLAPKNLLEPLRLMCGEGAFLHEHPGAPTNREALPRWRAKLINLVDTVFYLCFPNRDRCPNATADFHREHYLIQHGKGRGFSRLAARMVVWASRFLSSVRLGRPLFQRIYARMLPQGRFEELISAVEPDLMIGCTFGLGPWDAEFLVAARQSGTRSAVLVQTWDRTSNKGYPTVHPDAALVWSDVMKFECETLLEFAPGRVFVEGPPSWDAHFCRDELPPASEWRERLGIAPESKVVYYACGSFGNHDANMEVVPRILDLVETQPFPYRIHIILRVAPQYLVTTGNKEVRRKQEAMERLLEPYRNRPGITLAPPVGTHWEGDFLPSRKDLGIMLAAIAHCDVSLSHVSSQMIEACIFDKPAVNVEYGRRRTGKYDIEISKYLTEHLLRIYRTGAVLRADTFEKILDHLRFALERPEALQAERKRLVDQEVPVNRGCASAATVKRLVILANGTPTSKTEESLLVLDDCV